MPKKIILGLVVFILVYTLTGFYLLPHVGKYVLTDKLSENLHRQVTIEDIDTNPYILSAKVKGLVIKDLEGKDTFSSFEELYINLQAISAFKQALVIKEIRLLGPYVKILRKAPSQYNFSDLIKKDRAQNNPEDAPLSFFLGNIQVDRGRVDVVDAPKNKHHELTDIVLALPFLSNIGENSEIFVQPHFEATINGTRTVVEGRSKPFHDSLETLFQIDLNGIDIPYYLEYLPKQIRMKILSGTLDLQASISYTQFKQDKPPVLKTSGKLGLSNLSITDMKDLPLLTIPRISIEVAPSQILARSVHLAGVDIISPEVHIRRDKKGAINFGQVLKKTQPTATTAETPETQPFSLTIDKADLKGGTFTFSDNSTPDPVKLTGQDLEISAQNISTGAGSTGTADLTCRLNRKGSVSTRATFGMDPLFCNAKLNLAGMEPAWIQPYFSDQIRIIISKGSASSEGTLALKKDSKKGLSVSYKGNAALTNFASVDKDYADEFVTWKSLSLNTIDAGFNPSYIKIKEIALTDSFSRVIINPDGRLNLSTIVTQPHDTKKPEQEEAKNSIENIRIAKISLKNASLSFLDKNIKPNYTTRLTNIEGSVIGLTSQETKAATINLSGKLEGTSPLLIEGKINPLKEDLFVDLHVNFKDIDLTPESPYAGKYMGYTIHKGKLSLDLNYLIDKKKLESLNNVSIDQFTFGNPVKSDEKTSLPVKFAISLLKDPQGKINLDLPVTGQTDDPQFRIGKIILQMLGNIIKKAATSPFSALAAMYPGADQLNYVEFEHGRATLPEDCEKNLAVLLQILSDKPSINLEIQGYADREHDRNGLIQYFFEKKLKSQKLMAMLKKGSPAVAVDEIVIAPDEFERYLKKAYKAETFPKPKNALGLTKSLPAREMEKLIIEHIEVGDNDLRLLAAHRAQQLKSCLIKSQKVNPERIFLVKKQPLSPEKIEGVANSRVDLNLQ